MLPEKFLEKVEVTDSCWLWKNSKKNWTYGVFSNGDKMVTAHRFSWEHSNGEVKNGLFVLHKCDNPPCVNPDHLFLGTHQDNMKDMMEKGRHRSVTRKGALTKKLPISFNLQLLEEADKRWKELNFNGRSEYLMQLIRDDLAKGAIKQ